MIITKRIQYWIPVFLWMGLTYLMSTASFSAEHTSLIIEPILRFLFPSISLHELHLVHGVIRKLAHLTEYFVLSLLLFRAFRGGSTEPHFWKWALYSVLVVACYAASDEFHQMYVASRTSSIIDVGIDTLGGILGLCVSSAWQLRRRHSHGVDTR